MQPKVNQTVTSVRISEEVLETIVQNVLEEIPGVARLTPKKKGLLGLLSAEPAPRAVNRVGDAVTVDLSVELAYGYKLKAVCAEIQQKVKDAVQDMTGIAVSRVNVHVSDIVQTDGE